MSEYTPFLAPSSTTSHICIPSKSTREHLATKVRPLGLTLIFFLLAPLVLAAAETPPSPAAEQTSSQVLCSDSETESTAASQALMSVEDLLSSEAIFASSGPCKCIKKVTPPKTKVGATCLKARQKAAAAARELAVCPAGQTHCRNTTHSVAPCQPIPGGYSATAVATYYCKFCL